MRPKSEGMKPQYPKIIGLLLVSASIIAIVALYVFDISFLYEPKHLLGITNTLFTAIIPAIVAFFAARIYLRTGSFSVLLMGCGMLGFGLCRRIGRMAESIAGRGQLQCYYLQYRGLSWFTLPFYRCDHKLFRKITPAGAGKTELGSAACLFSNLFICGPSFICNRSAGRSAIFHSGVRSYGPSANRTGACDFSICSFFSFFHEQLHKSEIGFPLLVFSLPCYAGFGAICVLHPENRRKSYRLGR